MSERCPHTTRLVHPKSCTLCLGAVPRVVVTTGAGVTIDGELAEPAEPGRMTYYSQRGVKARAARRPL